MTTTTEAMPSGAMPTGAMPSGARRERRVGRDLRGERRGTERAAWTCPNCQRETRPPRKRCADCGTSRY